MNRISTIALFCTFISIQGLWGQSPTPAPAQKGAILIIGATAHLGNGNTIANSAIGFENGQITMVADATTIRLDRNKYSKIFDASGKHVYPGFIAPSTTVGLVEIDAIRATQDYAETGAYNPNARTIVAYNTDSDIPPTLRTNGILLAQISPAGGVISGTSAVVQMDAWNYEDAAVRTEDGVHLNWPSLRSFGGFANPEMKKNEQYDKDVQYLHQFFKEAKAYAQPGAQMPVNLKYEAMRSVFNQKTNLYIHTNDARTMQESVIFAEQHGVKPVLVGAADAWMITGFLKEHAVPVILFPTQSLPARDDDDVDQPYKTAAALHQAEVLFSLSSIGSWRQRNLPFQAGQAVGYGLPYEAAVKAITLNTAKILGIDAKNGSLEVGKDATLFISEGDALDMRTCKVTAAFIQGRDISLDNKQKQLYKKFEENRGKE
jgi:imidazolonepropionase-like amidohydrolase